MNVGNAYAENALMNARNVYAGNTFNAENWGNALTLPNVGNTSHVNCAFGENTMNIARLSTRGGFQNSIGRAVPLST